jgi:adenosine deaminase
MALYAELHRHLGGSIVPRVLWRYLQRSGHPLGDEYPIYDDFESYYTRPRASLSEYLELHSLVEKVQSIETLPYFISKLIRGAFVFESICYLELRYTPYYRTDSRLSDAGRIEQMREVANVVAQAGKDSEYPIVMSQIFCIHSQLPSEINLAMLDLALKMPEIVCGIDMAGPDVFYSERMDEWIDIYSKARAAGLKTTGHLFETMNGCDPRLLPYLNRIGHGIQIPLRFPQLLPELARRGQCLEVCPTTYLKTGTLPNLASLRDVFSRCENAGVDIAICTDNAGMHNVRLPWEIENLLTQDIIDFATLNHCLEASFRHAFAWPAAGKTPAAILREALEKHEPL